MKHIGLQNATWFSQEQSASEGQKANANFPEFSSRTEVECKGKNISSILKLNTKSYRWVWLTLMNTRDDLHWWYTLVLPFSDKFTVIQNVQRVIEKPQFEILQLIC